MKQEKLNIKHFKVVDSIGGLVKFEPFVEPVPGDVKLEVVVGKDQVIRRGGLFDLFDRAVKQAHLTFMPKLYGLYQTGPMEAVLYEEKLGPKLSSFSQKYQEKLLKEFVKAFSQTLVINDKKLYPALPSNITLEDFRIGFINGKNVRLFLIKTPELYLQDMTKENNEKISQLLDSV